MNLVYTKPLIPLDLKKIYFIMLHHIDKKFATAQDIHKWHLENGWSGAGYNEYIRKDGELIILRGDNIGAHCENMNSKSYGIACEGDYDVEPIMPEKQFNKLLERVIYNKNRFPNKITISKHSDFGDTNCPGAFFPYDRLLNMVNNDTARDIKILVDHKIINSPDYWIKNAVEGGVVYGEYAKLLIKNVANILNKK